MIRTIICLVALALPASQAVCSDWDGARTAGNFVGTRYRHDDGGFLLVVCDTSNKRIRIMHKEPRANWKAGDTVGVTTKNDAEKLGGATSKGQAVSSNVVLVRASLHLWTMGNARRFFMVSADNYGRIYPAAGFKSATEPVLRACGDTWKLLRLLQAGSGKMGDPSLVKFLTLTPRRRSAALMIAVLRVSYDAD